MNKLLLVAKTAYERAKQKISAGESPKFLGIDGLVAVMYERIVQYGNTKDQDLILDLAADALLALDIVMPDMGGINFQKTPEEYDPEQDEPQQEEENSDPTEGGRFRAIKPGEEAPTTVEDADG